MRQEREANARRMRDECKAQPYRPKTAFMSDELDEQIALSPVEFSVVGKYPMKERPYTAKLYADYGCTPARKL